MKKAFKKDDIVVALDTNEIEIIDVSVVSLSDFYCRYCSINSSCYRAFNRKVELLYIQGESRWAPSRCACFYDKATKQEEFLYTLGIIKKRGEDVN